MFHLKNICSPIWKPCIYTFSPCVISKCLRIRALVCKHSLITVRAFDKFIYYLLRYLRRRYSTNIILLISSAAPNRRRKGTLQEISAGFFTTSEAELEKAELLYALIPDTGTDRIIQP